MNKFKIEPIKDTAKKIKISGPVDIYIDCDENFELACVYALDIKEQMEDFYDKSILFVENLESDNFKLKQSLPVILEKYHGECSCEAYRFYYKTHCLVYGDTLEELIKNLSTYLTDLFTEDKSSFHKFAIEIKQWLLQKYIELI